MEDRFLRDNASKASNMQDIDSKSNEFGANLVDGYIKAEIVDEIEADLESKQQKRQLGPTSDIIDFEGIKQHGILSSIEHLTEKLRSFEEVSTHIAAKFDDDYGCATRCYSATNLELLDRSKEKPYSRKPFLNDKQSQSEKHLRRLAIVKQYNNHGFDNGHMIPKGNFIGSKQFMKDSHNCLNYAPMYPNYNRGPFCVKEILVRAIIRKYGSGIECTGAIFEANPNVSVADNDAKLAFIVPTKYYTILVVQKPDGRFMRFTFILDHNENSPYNSVFHMLKDTKTLADAGVDDPFPGLNNSIEVTKLSDLSNELFDIIQWLKAIKWGVIYKAIPKGIQCSGSDNELCSSISKVSGGQFCRGPFGMFLCNNHYHAYQGKTRSLERHKSGNKSGKGPTPKGIQCSSSDNEPCSSINGVSGGRFLRGPFGMILCNNHYQAWQSKTRSLETYKPDNKPRGPILSGKGPIPKGIQCSGSDNEPCSSISKVSSGAFRRGPFGMILCNKHYQAYVGNNRLLETYGPQMVTQADSDTE